MRYLKITAQDLNENGKADTVFFHFYNKTEGPSADKLIYKAAAIDMTADGRVDLQFAEDVNNDGKSNTRDQQLIKKFANAFLKLNWFNQGDVWGRYLQIYSEDFTTDDSPEVVRLNFHEGEGIPRSSTIVYSASAYDVDNNGSLEWIVHDDLDNDGDVDKKDEFQVKFLASEFLKFNWK